MRTQTGGIPKPRRCAINPVNPWWRAAALLLLTLTTSCASTRLTQFETFATAGREYTEAVTDLSREVGETVIDTDSYFLVRDRDQFEPAQRETVFVERTQALKNYLNELHLFREHTLLLSRYFQELERLATSKADAEAGEATGKLMERLQELDPHLQNATVGEAPVADFIPAVTEVAVGSFKARALERELRAHAPMIERELALQQGYLAALAEDLESDLRDLNRQRETSEVALRFIDDGALPKSWTSTRREVLTAPILVESVQRGTEAAEALRRAFTALAEHKAGGADFHVLFADISALLDLVHMVKGESE